MYFPGPEDEHDPTKLYEPWQTEQPELSNQLAVSYDHDLTWEFIPRLIHAYRKLFSSN